MVQQLLDSLQLSGRRREPRIIPLLHGGIGQFGENGFSEFLSINLDRRYHGGVKACAILLADPEIREALRANEINGQRLANLAQPIWNRHFLRWSRRAPQQIFIGKNLFLWQNQLCIPIVMLLRKRGEIFNREQNRLLRHSASWRQEE